MVAVPYRYAIGVKKEVTQIVGNGSTALGSNQNAVGECNRTSTGKAYSGRVAEIPVIEACTLRLSIEYAQPCKKQRR
jgi:hypothetical protein